MIWSMRKKIGGCVWLFIMGWLVNCSHTGPMAHHQPEPPQVPSQHAAPPHKETLPPQPNKSLDAEPLPSPDDSPLVHEVQWPGETLFTIARWYTGTGENWKRLADANPTIKANRIHIGDTILIPGKLLITHQSMPSKFLKPLSSREKPSSSQQSSKPSKKEEVTLYGPVNVGPSTAGGHNKNGLSLPLEPLE